MSTYRERREVRAERLRGWAEKREATAAAVFKANEVHTRDHAFNTQPGHIPIRAKIIASEDRQFESLQTAAGMTSRASGIEHQLATSIYSDDPDAIEQLQAKVARLEEKREAMKAANAAYRKEHGAELKTMGVYARSQAVPYASYELTNLGATIRTAKQRVDEITRQQAQMASGERVGGRMMPSRYGGTCPDCGEDFDKGDTIMWYRSTREATHWKCPGEEG